ncbi:MAG: dihydroorotate dehydrogenase, partial [Planctomycetes bacterium]|nr:dihydroorotate dehydrogenase [Planctomycetota bacterium]
TFTLYSYEQASIWGPERYAEEVTRAKKTVGIPVIASINCITDEGWASYARRMEQAGADALELNTSCPHGSITFRGHEVHETILKVVEIVRREVRIPIITKLSPQLTIPLALTKEVERLGSEGVVIFNRLTGLDISTETERAVMHEGYAGHGGPWAIYFALRWISEIFPHVKLHISASGGAMDADDVVKFLLTGATTVQVCTAIYLRGFDVIRKMNEGLEQWMSRKGYQTLADFRGKVSGRKVLDINEVFRTHCQVAEIDPALCSACGLCAKVCIYFAPQKSGEKYAIGDRCDGCGLCPELCPKRAIRMVRA